ncbi:aminotransferase class I/II-fold pyridoxal phosphate-dependent enzyme [Breoghania sp. JC706]|uniref:aminotransferase class I/II-fold pyridoxal phosphate-dependent enzyme n=1 Tax=Breoghania sp. JC706 TaxID=3117732 RepID=UPI00300B85D9
MSPEKATSSRPRDPESATAFQRLNTLLDGLAPGAEPIVLTVGEPRHALPSFVGPVIAANLDDYRRYPPIRGTDEFRKTVAAWLDRRFRLGGLIDPDRHVLPLSGSREGLFYAAFTAVDMLGKQNPAILLPNPYYHPYSLGAAKSGAEAVYLDAHEASGFLPDLDALDPALLDRTVAFYFASPANPQGAVAPLDYWCRLIELARKHRFYVFADECYSEIYRETPPPGVLQAARELGGDLSNILAFNSLSKRSNLPGLRCGIAAGDADFIAEWTTLRNSAAPQVPMPAQAVAVAAYSDESHVEENRRLYNAKFEAAETILGPAFGYEKPEGGFFVWLDVSRLGGGVEAAKRLWLEQGVKVVPGAYLARTQADGSNPGTNFIRLAMVEDIDTTRRALVRVAALADTSIGAHGAAKG